MYELQKAIYNKLSGDAGLTADITGVFDHVPQDQGFPYITIGDISLKDWSSLTTIGFEGGMKIKIHSRYRGHKEARQIAEKIRQILHEGDISIDGHEFVNSRFISSNVVLESNGLTYRNETKFRLFFNKV